MEFARVSWITVCRALRARRVLLAIDGYTGYSIVVGAVGLAAAVNLLDYPRTGPPDPG